VRVNKRDDGFYDGAFCSMSTSPGVGGSYTSSVEVDVAAPGLVDQSLDVECPPYSGDDWPVHPGPGTYLSGPEQGTVLFEDGGEGPSTPWTFAFYRRTTDSRCIAPLTGAGAIYSGTESCDHRVPHFPYSTTGWAITPAFGGAAAGATLAFDVYRDVGPNDLTRVDVFPDGRMPPLDQVGETALLWSERGSTPTDRQWRHVEVTLPAQWFYDRPVRIRFAGQLPDAYMDARYKGWMIDNVRVTR
jgi:hypothetical protein